MEYATEPACLPRNQFPKWLWSFSSQNDIFPCDALRAFEWGFHPAIDRSFLIQYGFSKMKRRTPHMVLDETCSFHPRKTLTECTDNCSAIDSMTSMLPCDDPFPWPRACPLRQHVIHNTTSIYPSDTSNPHELLPLLDSYLHLNLMRSIKVTTYLNDFRDILAIDELVKGECPSTGGKPTQRHSIQ